MSIFIFSLLINLFKAEKFLILFIEEGFTFYLSESFFFRKKKIQNTIDKHT